MDENEVTTQADIIFSLVDEFTAQRKEIVAMINEIEVIREKIDTLIPTTLDTRYARFFEEKVKSITGLFNLLLDMRKEITKSIKDEIDIRRRIKNPDEIDDIEDMIDIRKMAKKIDQFKDEKNKLQSKRLEKLKEQKIEDGIDIPGITSRVEGH